MSAPVAVIIVNYTTAALTIEAVESLFARSACPLDIHVLDNASPGTDADDLARTIATRGWQDRVTFWPETVNHGFGRGNNVVLQALAARATPPEKVFLLNPDARLENDAVAHLAAALDADAAAGAAGAALIHPGEGPVSAAFRFPSGPGEVARVLNIGIVDRLLRRHRVALPPGHPGGVVDWVTGAAVMFRFAAVREVGFFDPAYFLYYEEVDLMRRLAAAGWHSRHVPEAVVHHVAGAATEVNSEKGPRRRPAYLYQSWRHYFVSAKGRARALATALAMIPAACINIGQARLRGRTAWLPERFLADHWRHAVWPLLRPGGRAR